MSLIIPFVLTAMGMTTAGAAAFMSARLRPEDSGSGGAVEGLLCGILGAACFCLVVAELA